MRQMERQDGNGLHFMLVLYELLRRFAQGAAPIRRRKTAVTEAAVWFVLLEDPAHPVLSREAAGILAREIANWLEFRWEPLTERTHQGLHSKDAGRFVIEHTYDCALALHWARLRRERGFLDAAGVVGRVAKGLAMHEQGSLRPERPFPETDAESAGGWIDVLTKDGRNIGTFESDGVFRLSPLAIKTALDHYFQRADSSAEGEPEGVAADVATSRELPAEEAEYNELQEAFQAAQVAEGVGREDTAARRAVRQFRVALDAKILSVRQLASQIKKDRKTVAAAYEAEKRIRPNP